MKLHRTVTFWLGIAAVTTGVALHLPMYYRARAMGYHMAGMPLDRSMVIGMVSVVVGLAMTVFGLLPGVRQTDRKEMAQLEVRALDDRPLGRSHFALIIAMAAAVSIDIMKPTTLAFIMPGVATEYGLKSTLNPNGRVPVALLPLCALTGVVMGSAIWGWLGDRIGRRASILLAAIMFIGTSICGAMPSFSANLLMCFLMGIAVGGMLPIAFTLLAETIPARHRSWLMVLIGGDVAGAYFITSFLSAHLQPHFGWRIMWLLGFPTGVLLILLNRWIPESPRYLLANGRPVEAQAVMARFGCRLVPPLNAPLPATAAPRTAYYELFSHPFRGLTLAVATFALGWGLVNNGFLLWLPTNLRSAGLDVRTADELLARGALIGLPAVFVVAALYGFWSSKRSIILFSLLTSVALIVFALIGDGIREHKFLLQMLIIMLLTSTSSSLAMLTPYSAETYPTLMRARGTGLAATCARGGGLVSIGLAVTDVAPPSLNVAAILGAVPTALAAIVIAYFGVETRGRRLEAISADGRSPPIRDPS
ncbi:MAG TPA: MFS transporter [Mycobacterium sp.]|nr:MFS transporter [Mycobacterium sp.]HTX95025.1 MFS transporter [Mycobacterium sp.]